MPSQGAYPKIAQVYFTVSHDLPFANKLVIRTMKRKNKQSLEKTAESLRENFQKGISLKFHT